MITILNKNGIGIYKQGKFAELPDFLNKMMEAYTLKDEYHYPPDWQLQWAFQENSREKAQSALWWGYIDFCKEYNKHHGASSKEKCISASEFLQTNTELLEHLFRVAGANFFLDLIDLLQDKTLTTWHNFLKLYTETKPYRDSNIVDLMFGKNQKKLRRVCKEILQNNALSAQFQSFVKNRDIRGVMVRVLSSQGDEWMERLEALKQIANVLFFLHSNETFKQFVYQRYSEDKQLEKIDSITNIDTLIKLIRLQLRLAIAVLLVNYNEKTATEADEHQHALMIQHYIDCDVSGNSISLSLSYKTFQDKVAGDFKKLREVSKGVSGKFLTSHSYALVTLMTLTNEYAFEFAYKLFDFHSLSMPRFFRDFHFIYDKSFIHYLKRFFIKFKLEFLAKPHHFSIFYKINHLYVTLRNFREDFKISYRLLFERLNDLSHLEECVSLVNAVYRENASKKICEDHVYKEHLEETMYWLLEIFGKEAGIDLHEEYEQFLLRYSTEKMKESHTRTLMNLLELCGADIFKISSPSIQAAQIISVLRLTEMLGDRLLNYVSRQLFKEFFKKYRLHFVNQPQLLQMMLSAFSYLFSLHYYENEFLIMTPQELQAKIISTHSFQECVRLIDTVYLAHLGSIPHSELNVRLIRKISVTNVIDNYLRTLDTVLGTSLRFQRSDFVNKHTKRNEINFTEFFNEYWTTFLGLANLLRANLFTFLEGYTAPQLIDFFLKMQHLNGKAVGLVKAYIEKSLTLSVPLLESVLIKISAIHFILENCRHNKAQLLPKIALIEKALTDVTGLTQGDEVMLIIDKLLIKLLASKLKIKESVLANNPTFNIVQLAKLMLATKGITSTAIEAFSYSILRADITNDHKTLTKKPKLIAHNEAISQVLTRANVKLLSPSDYPSVTFTVDSFSSLKDRYIIKLWNKTDPQTLFLKDTIHDRDNLSGYEFYALQQHRVDNATYYVVIEDQRTNKPVACCWLFFACISDNYVYLVVNTIDIKANLFKSQHHRNIFMPMLLSFISDFSDNCGAKNVMINPNAFPNIKDELCFLHLTTTSIQKVGGCFNASDDRFHLQSDAEFEYFLHTLKGSKLFIALDSTEVKRYYSEGKSEAASESQTNEAAAASNVSKRVKRG